MKRWLALLCCGVSLASAAAEQPARMRATLAVTGMT
jgi:hypothetical protein